jgi:hypothetical protein
MTTSGQRLAVEGSTDRRRKSSRGRRQSEALTASPKMTKKGLRPRRKCQSYLLLSVSKPALNHVNVANIKFQCNCRTLATLFWTVLFQRSVAPVPHNITEFLERVVLNSSVHNKP